MNRWSTYLKIIMIVAACGVLFLFVSNLVIDPEGRFDLVDITGVNEEKTQARERGGRALKSLILEQEDYGTVLLGSSRVENGIDPKHPAFSARRVYNAALGGTNFYETYQVFNFVREHMPLDTIVLGVDFLLFSTSRTVSADFPLSRFADMPSWLMNFRYLASYSTLHLSFETVQDNWQGRKSVYTEQGMRNRALFYNKSRINHRDLFIKILTRNFLVNQGTYGGLAYGQERMDLLQSVVEQCRRDGIALYLFIPPIHARNQEAQRVLGLDMVVERWKRDLVNLLAADAARHPQEKPIPLWDFTGYNSLTTEEVPSAEEEGKPMRWYWESSHFKKELGDLVLDRMFDHHEPSRTIPDDFGVLLTTKNIEAHLARIRAERQRYHETHRQEIAEVEYLALATARFRASRNGADPSAVVKTATPGVPD